MDFTRIDHAMSVCKSHLVATSTANTEIESYLVGYLLSVIYAEFEQRIRAMVCKRAERASDVDVHNFVVSAVGRLMRGIKIAEVKGIIGQFHPQCSADLDAQVNDSQMLTMYTNMILNRHGVAHVSGSNMTFLELEASLVHGKLVVEAVAIALGLTDDEVLGL